MPTAPGNTADGCHIAQYNIALGRWPVDDRRMAAFRDNVKRINGLAERSPGYLWRMVDETGPDAPVFPDHPTMTFTISLWRDIASLAHFTWNTLHKRFRLRREEWFLPWPGPYLALWPVPIGNRPSGAEAQSMLEKLAREGPSEQVFGTEAIAREPA